jgi:hypothetical protein
VATNHDSYRYEPTTTALNGSVVYVKPVSEIGRAQVLIKVFAKYIAKEFDQKDINNRFEFILFRDLRSRRCRKYRHDKQQPSTSRQRRRKEPVQHKSG